MMYGKVACVS